MAASASAPPELSQSQVPEPWAARDPYRQQAEALLPAQSAKSRPSDSKQMIAAAQSQPRAQATPQGLQHELLAVGPKSSTKKSRKGRRERLSKRCLSRHPAPSSGADSSDDTQYDYDYDYESHHCGRHGTLLGTLNRSLKVAGARVMKIALVLLLIDLLVYNWPIEPPDIEPKVAAAKPRPKFSGPLKVNELLDQSETLFMGQFHAPESMAWTKDNRAFYTGVEGGFILLVEPYEERWTVAAKLNARNAVRDLSASASFGYYHANYTAASGRQLEPTPGSGSGLRKQQAPLAPFCARDVELYGARAEFEPRLVSISRCSRPLGIRLAPDNSYLYVMDPFAGLFRVDNLLAGRRQVSKLIDFSRYHAEPSRPLEEASAIADERVIFADDIAVDWGAGASGGDLVFMSDCSKRWTVRYLFRLIAENDDTGRVLAFDTGAQVLRQLAQITPVQLDGGQLDRRNLSFPNGVELTANGSALLVNDLNNRRVLMHHLRGPLAGQTRHLLWVPGYPDNVRRGLDTATGEPTYWLACGCAVSDGYLEISELFNPYPRLRKLALKWLHLVGRLVETLGTLADSTRLKDAGFLIKALWLRVDPYCTHGLVLQFTEQGQVLRSLHAPHFGSLYKILSEAHEVPVVGAPGEPPANVTGSLLYLGSVYYSYLGRVALGPLAEPSPDPAPDPGASARSSSD